MNTARHGLFAPDRRSGYDPAMIVARRPLLVALAASLLPGRGEAQAPGFAIDWQGGPETPAVLASLRAQIALVRALPIDPAIAAFFAGETVTVDRAEGTATRAGPRGIFFERRPVPPGNPVLLHELLHRFHLLRLPGGFANPDVRRFHAEAVAGGRWPPAAYMLKNPVEFFAMTASVVLHGHAARPPFRREAVHEKQPDLYAWIVRTFGLREGTAAVVPAGGMA